MSKFNPYLWKLYTSGEGKAAIETFGKFIDGETDGYVEFIESLMKEYCPDKDLIKETGNFIRNFVAWFNEDSSDTEANSDTSNEGTGTEVPDNTEGQISLEDYVLRYYQVYMDQYKTHYNAYFEFSRRWADFSSEMAYDFPNDLIPYYFPACFNVLQRIAAYFGIELPEIPAKAQKEKRVLYYVELCKVLHEFRIENNLTPEELWALLYDYGPKVVGGLDWVMSADELKEAHRVFVFGASNNEYLRNPEPGHIFLWQGNPEMKPGDIAVLYQWSPVRSFVSVWRAVSVGYNDPMFMHHRIVCYAAVSAIPPVSWNELKTDEIFSQTPLVRSKMSQMDGARIKNAEYMHLLEMSAKNGELSDAVPEMPVYSEIEAPEMKLERDVEVFYLEGLLQRLGWDPEDYERQIPVRDGRHTHVFPDYVINYDAARSEGEIILEAKLTIRTEKQAEHDKGQAKAYARLLRSRALVLVSKEGIWLAESRDDFGTMSGYTWAELQNENLFDEVYEVIGKGKNGKRKK